MPTHLKTRHPGVAFFDTQAERLVRLYGSKHSHFDRLRLFTEQVRQTVPAGATILDFGCGPGVITLALAECGYEVVGLDAAPKMIDVALAEASRAGIANASFHAVDGGVRSFGSSLYDAIVCSSVIEFIPDEAALLEGFAAALKPGGRLFVSVPNGGSLFGRVRDWSGTVLRLDRLPGRRYRKHSLRTYSRRQMAHKLQGVGLKQESCTCFESPIPGRIGVLFSRLSFLATMMLMVARKAGMAADEDSSDATPVVRSMGRVGPS